MKKSKILAGALALMLAVTGCGSKTTDKVDVVKNATEKMKGLDNYHIAMTIDMSFEENGVSASFTVNTEQDYDVKNNTSYMLTSTSMLGMDMESHNYTEVKDGKTTVYTSEDGESWVKQITEEDTNSNFDFDLMSKTKDVKTEKEENGVTTYTATLDQEATKELLKDMDMDSEEGIEVKETTIKFSVDKDGYMTRYEITVPVTAEGQTSTVKMTAKFSEFNKVGDIVIPQEVIDNAKDF